MTLEFLADLRCRQFYSVFWMANWTRRCSTNG